MADVDPWISSVGDAAGGAVTAIGQNWLNRKQFERQKEFWNLQNEYNMPVNEAARLRAAGLTEAAIAQHLAGITSSPGVPMVASSPSGTPLPLGSSFMEGKLKASEVLQRESAADQMRAETDETRQRMDWNEKRWFVEVREAFSRAMKNIEEAKLFGAQRKYYDEFATTLEQKRPWEIKTMQAGLSKLSADIAESIARRKLIYEKVNTERSVQFVNQTQGEKNINESFNLGQQGFALMWENDLRSCGFNPSQSLWQNLGRLAFVNPKRVLRYVDNFQAILGGLDNKLKESLGDNYKRNIALGFAAYKVGLWNRGRKNDLSNRIRNYSSAVSNFIPFTHPSGSGSWSR